MRVIRNCMFASRPFCSWSLLTSIMDLPGAFSSTCCASNELCVPLLETYGLQWAVDGHICDASCSRCPVVEPCWDRVPPFGTCADIKTAFECTQPFVVKGELLVYGLVVGLQSLSLCS